jgi:hypothetical protein
VCYLSCGAVYLGTSHINAIATHLLSPLLFLYIAFKIVLALTASSKMVQLGAAGCLYSGCCSEVNSWCVNAPLFFTRAAYGLVCTVAVHCILLCGVSCAHLIDKRLSQSAIHSNFLINISCLRYCCSVCSAICRGAGRAQYCSKCRTFQFEQELAYSAGAVC